MRDEHLLLVRMALADGREFWLLPGGGREASDGSAESCVMREVEEETGLVVDVERLLCAVPAHPDDTRYGRWHTYLCRVRRGVARGGATDGVAGVVAVSWLPLFREDRWPAEVRNDPFLYPQLVDIAAALA